jgi:hypothetical protein
VEERVPTRVVRYSVPVARTPLEAEVYLSLLPCDRCGETGTDWEYGARTSVDGRIIDQYVGECPSCGADRAATFARAGDPPPGAGTVSRFGGAQPSELLDAGQWLAVAGSVEALATMDGTSLRDRLTCVEYARDAYLEALKFLPPGAQSVPESALFSEEGRRAARAEPLNLTRDWIEAQASDAGDWADRLRASADSDSDSDSDSDDRAGDGSDDADPDPPAEDAVDETADLALAHTRLRDELLAVAGEVFPAGTPLVTRDDGLVAVERAPGAAVEYCVADVAVSVPAPGDGRDGIDAPAGRRWPAAATLTGTAGVLRGRGWSVEEPRQERGHWALAARWEGHSLYATMREDEGILRLTGETAQYRRPARHGR